MSYGHSLGGFVFVIIYSSPLITLSAWGLLSRLAIENSDNQLFKENSLWMSIRKNCLNCVLASLIRRSLRMMPPSFNSGGGDFSLR
ncbi:MAG: hypothetical protein ACOH2I_03815 [Pseudomonas sp.]